VCKQKENGLRLIADAMPAISQSCQGKRNINKSMSTLCSTTSQPKRESKHEKKDRLKNKPAKNMKGVANPPQRGL